MLRTIETAGCLVLGGGVAGVAAAWAVAKRGEKVLLVEQFAPGHDHGSSHGDGRIFRCSYSEPVYVEMARRALVGWRELERAAVSSFLDLCGNWDCGPIASPELEGLERTMREAGLVCERLSAAESNARFPLLHLPAGAEALFQPEGGVLFARRAMTALWEAAQAAGGRAVSGEPILAIEAGSQGVELVARGGRRYRAPRLVVAAGGWSWDLLAGLDLALPLQVTRELVAYFSPREGIDHSPAKLPTVIDYHTEKPFYALPQLEVPGIKVGWHMAGRPIDRPDEAVTLDRDNLAAVEDFAQARFRHLQPRPLEISHCLYTMTPDHNFVLDRHPTEPGIAVAAGLSGHGFKFGPVLGEILAALALGEAPPVEIGMFGVGRFG